MAPKRAPRGRKRYAHPGRGDHGRRKKRRYWSQHGQEKRWHVQIKKTPPVEAAVQPTTQVVVTVEIGSAKWTIRGDLRVHED